MKNYVNYSLVVCFFQKSNLPELPEGDSTKLKTLNIIIQFCNFQFTLDPRHTCVITL